MRTLYININNEPIQSNDELEVLKHDLDSDFFFYLGEKIAKGCKVENENALITDFNTQGNEEGYKSIIAQWNELKNILFSEKCEGEFKFALPDGYIHWLRYSGKYNHVHDKNFSHGEPTIITIDLEELYEDSVEDLQRKILRKLQRNDLYHEIDEIVFNDDAVTRSSPIVSVVKEKYDSVGFKAYKKWLQKNDRFEKKDIIYSEPELNESNNLNIIQDLSTKEWVEIIEKYDEFSDFSEGLARVCLNGKYGFIDKTGKEVISCIYDYANDFCEGVSIVSLNHTNILINQVGSESYLKQYDEVGVLEPKFAEGLLPVKLNGKYGFINSKGTETVPLIYDFAFDFSNGLAPVELNGKWGYINCEGIVKIPFKYDFAYNFEEKYATVELSGKKGVIDITGKEIAIPVYDSIDGLGNGIFIVKLNGKAGLLDSNGRVIVPFIYDNAWLLENVNGDWVLVELNEKQGVINSKGEIIVPIIYKCIEHFNGATIVQANDEYGFINNESQKVVMLPQYDALDFINKDFYLTKINYRKGVVDKYGKELLLPVYDDVEYYESFKLFVAHNNEIKYYYDTKGNRL